MDLNLEKYLHRIIRPARYINHELNTYRKEWNNVRLKWCLVFPDIYDIGISHRGLQILYQIVNSRDDALADRLYSPWLDMDGIIRGEIGCLRGLETMRSISEFDILGTIIPYELTYTNIINLLDLAGIPILSKNRGDNYPLIIGGGVGSFNPEPLADIFDVFVLGDGEEVVGKISDEYIEWNRKGPKREFLKRLTRIDGIYVPSFFETIFDGGGNLKEIKSKLAGYDKVYKAKVQDFSRFNYDERPIVPFIQSVHDRVSVEIQRGCTRGCRFCQAGYIYRPVRQADPCVVLRQSQNGLDNTGHEDLSFLSLSAGDYLPLPQVMKEVTAGFEKSWLNISLPSLRVEALSPDILDILERSKSGSFTLAPEAATQRLRNIINKRNREEDLLHTAESVFNNGWHQIKLYFMIGLPGEQDEDVLAIGELARKVLWIGKRYTRRAKVTVSVSTFVPKSHTPFQWMSQISPDESRRRQAILRGILKGGGMEFKWHNPYMSHLEGLFSRGDRRLTPLLIEGQKRGLIFTAWDEHLNFDKWSRLMEEFAIDYKNIIERERNIFELLPWDHLYCELDKTYLAAERNKALDGMETPDCAFDKCQKCGVCDFKEVRPQVCKEFNVLYPRSKKESRSANPDAYRYRIEYTKGGDLIWLGHLELMNVLRRSFRRAKIPVRYSEGFHPHARISMGQPLPVGVECRYELFDVFLTEEIDDAEITMALNDNLPSGIEIISTKRISNKDRPPDRLISEETYEIKPGMLKDGKSIEERINRFNSSKSYLHSFDTRRGRLEIDLKSIVKDLAILESGDIRFEILKGGVSLRPWDIASVILDMDSDTAMTMKYKKVSVKLCQTN